MKCYDFIYLTNTPSFYKLNLCNEIAKEHNLLLVLYGYGGEAVNKELKDDGRFCFDYYFLHPGDAHKRSKWQTFWRLLKLMRKVEVHKIIYAGWMSPEYNVYAFLSPKSKNVMVCESSILDVSFAGLAGWVKKRIINRMGVALPSGKPHAELFYSIDFKGCVHITGSVGIFNKGERKLIERPRQPIRYLYVGRLVEVKNIGLLIDEFNRNGKPLTIVGNGALEQMLKQQANDNITFLGFVENEKLGDIYQAHDVFILPSKYEPWGLVVEEALYWGLPVIVSDKVGSGRDMVRDLHTGNIFPSESIDGLHRAILHMEGCYMQYKEQVLNIDWLKRDREQVKAYTSLMD